MSSDLLARLKCYFIPVIWIFLGVLPRQGISQACDSPFAQAPDSISTTSAKLHWISAGADTFDIELIGAADTAMYEIAIGDSFFWSGLLPATSYKYRVRAVCNGMVSDWSNQISFSTHLSNPTSCGAQLEIGNNSCNYNNQFYIDVDDAPGQELGGDVVLKEVRLLIAHTYDQDLEISLVAPDGTTIVLSDRNGEEYNNYGNPYDSTCQELVVFADDYCRPSIKDFVATANDSTNFVGTFRPEEPLSTINATAIDPNGVWKLIVCDNQISDIGTLEYVDLVFLPLDCALPVAPSAGQIGGDFTEIDWDVNNSSDSVFIEYGVSDFVPGTENMLGGGDTIVGISGALSHAVLVNLLPSTTYYAYLRTKCGSGYSQNVCFYFTTACANISLETDFDDLSSCNPKCNAACPLSGIWHNLTNDGNDWVVRAGKTPSFNTGPNSDVSGNGKYIYTETSYPCGSGALAVLQSNCIFVGDDIANNCAFSFYAHMKGNHIGTLRLLAGSINSSNWDTLWTHSGAQGNDWNKYYIGLSDYVGETIQLRFEGVRGGSTGDMALDELVFYGNTLDLGAANTYYTDSDGDGYGDANNPRNFCSSSPPSGFVTDSTDCDDSRDWIHPLAPEIKCNQVDENCNGPSDDQVLDNPVANSILSFCESNSYTLSLDTAPFGQYYWYIDGLFAGSGQSVSVSNISDGQQIQVMDSVNIAGYTCKSGFTTIEMEISPNPFIGEDTVVVQCSGQPFGLSSIVNEDTLGQGVLTKVYGAWPLVNANLITTDSIIAEDYGTIYYQSTTSKGCSDVKQVDFQVLPTPDVEILPLVDTFELCPNELTVLQAGVASGIAPFSYSWSNGFNSEIALAQISSSLGTYSSLSVELTDSTGCRASDTVYIGNNASVSGIEIQNLQDVSTCGGGDGGFDVIPQGGVPPYDISWSGPVSGVMTGVMTASLSGLTQGAYQIGIKDSSPGGCYVSFSGILINSPGLVVNLDTVIDISCYGSTDGAISLNVVGNNPTYAWSDSVSTKDRTNLSAGLYSVTITDANCSLSFNDIEVKEPDVLQIFVANKQDISCYGANDGVVDLNVFGGVTPYDYHWTAPMNVTGSAQSDLVPGSYFCEVEDNNGCLMGPIQVDINEPDSLMITAELTPIVCHGEQNGGIVVTPSGGVGDYLYAWEDSLLDGRINQDLMPGDYLFTLTDGNGCTATELFTLSEPPEIQLDSIAYQNSTCLGISDGFLQAFGTGGTGDLTYHWEGFPQGALIQNLTAGAYHLVIEDTLGCHSDTLSANLSYSKHIFAYIDSIRPVSCYGDSDGFISVFPAGGTMPYQYFWSNNTQAEDLSGVSAGIYDLTITDAEGCRKELDSMKVDTPDSLILDLLADPVQCYGELSGSVVGYVQGGTLPYKYQWNTGDTLQSLVGIASGSYLLTVTDARQCQQMESVFVGEPDSIIAQVQHVDMVASCTQAYSPGSINVDVQGGIEPYAFAWSNGDTVQNINGLDTGQYSLVITDINGCIANVKPVTIYHTDSDFEIIPVSVKNVQCHGADDGAIILEGIGGTMPYNFNWSNGNTTSNNWLETPFDTISQLANGRYNLTITDAKGCTAVSDSVSIVEPPLFHVNLDSVRYNPCGTNMDGQIFTTASGGVGAYHYLWNTLSFEEDPDSLSVGVYTVTVVDGNDCLATLPSPVVLESLVDDFDIFVDTVVHQNCNNLGSIAISVPFSVVGAQYLWSNADTTEDIHNLLPGYYSVTVTDASGCTNSLDSIEVTATQNAMNIVLDSIHNVSCFGGADGFISVNVSNGTAPFSYYWSNNSTDSMMISGLEAGIYSVTVEDSHSCIVISGGLHIGEPLPLQYSADITDAIITQNGQIQLDVTGGLPPFLFQWDEAAHSQTTNPATNLVPGDYSVTVTDHNGCELVINDLTVGGVVGTESLGASSLKIYPNPTDDFFFIDYPAGETVQVEVISILGVRYRPRVRRMGEQLEVFIPGLPAGIYRIELTQKGGIRRVGLLSVE